MNDLIVLRLYCHYGDRPPTKTFWENLIAPPLAHYLATRAQAFGIEQVIVHRVSVGFLKGGSLQYDLPEFSPHKLPQCLELIDRENKLRGFLERYTDELRGVRVVLLRGEELLPK